MGDLETVAAGLSAADATGAVIAVFGTVAAVLFVMFGIRKVIKLTNRS